MYDQQKAENSFLAMINACVSHELRNPLNSIIAQNIEKQHLYKELSQIIQYYKQKGQITSNFIQEVTKI